MKYVLSFVLFLPTVGSGAEVSDLKPIMAVPDKVVLQNDFSKSTPLKKTEWLKRQGTRWNIEDGVLRGLPSTTAYQASKPHHKGFEPRTSVPVTPQQFVAAFSVRFLEGSETAIVPFVEFGHHVCRVRFSKETGIELIAEGETVRLAEAKDYRYKPGQWYHVLAEMKGDEFVMQFADGPTLYARHHSFATSPSSGGNGLGIAGPKGGKVEVDNITIWSIRESEQPSWSDTRDALPMSEPSPTGKVKKKKNK